jgi:outer membrane lipoprotein SlyB
MKLRLAGTVLAAGVLTLAGCATYDPYGSYAVYQPGPVYSSGPVYAPAPAYAGAPQQVRYGVVERIDMYRGGSSSPESVGTILGGLAGGLLGHQIGSGSGNTAATIAGAVGGAVVGNQIERSNASDRYRVVVRLDDGGTLTLSDVAASELRVGDRVEVVNGRVFRV